MKLVFEAQNSLEAHMILNLLEGAGLHGSINGELLQGAMGELPASGVVSVVVEDKDYWAAREVVVNWERQQVLDGLTDESVAVGAGKLKNRFSAWLIGVLCGMTVMMAYFQSPVTNGGIDYNGDGRLDERWSFVDGRMIKTEMDSNFDGKIDSISRYDHKGLIKEADYDQNFDGVFETEFYFHNGSMIAQFSDTTGDGLMDLKVKLKHGVVETISFIDVETFKPIKIEYYDAFKLRSAEVDTDGDGVMDRLFEYDAIENVSREESISIY